MDAATLTADCSELVTGTRTITVTDDITATTTLPTTAMITKSTSTSTSTLTCATAGSPTIILASPTGVVPEFNGNIAGPVDDGFYQISLPFPITVYNVSSFDVYMGVNGAIFLHDPSGPAVIPDASAWNNSRRLGGSNVAIPAGCGNFTDATFCPDGLPYYSVAPYWDQLHIAAGTPQGLYYQILDPDFYPSVIFEWYTSHVDKSSEYYHFTLQFFSEYSDWVEIAYYQIADRGAGGTVGLQGALDSIEGGIEKYSQYSQYSYNEPILYRGLVLDWDPSNNTWTPYYQHVC